MKKAIIAVAATLAIGSAHAEWVAKTPNNDGGDIVITSVKSKNCQGDHIAYTNTSKGNASWGCYYVADGKVFIHWGNGERRIYNLDDTWLYNNDFFRRANGKQV